MADNRKKKSKKLKRRVLNVFILLCFAAAAVLLYQGIITKLDEKRSAETYSKIEDLYVQGIALSDNATPDPVVTNTPEPTAGPAESPSPTVSPSAEPTNTPEPTQQPEPTDTWDPGDEIPQRPPLDREGILDSFNALLDVNEDIRGFIKMADSTIAYSVVQGIDNKFYLERDIYGKKTISASIFMDYRNNVDVLDDNTIIYGHNLNSGMFNDLDYFVNEETRDEFYAKNGIFRFDTVYKYMQWEVFSAYVVDKDDFNYLITNFTSLAAHMAFIDETLERSFVDYGIEVTPDDRILTLSTCNHWYNDSRTVVHARLITP
jgi:sortase B